jgi:hypothetical protein
MYPGHRNLLPSYFEPPKSAGTFLEKPFFSREGEGIVVKAHFSGARPQANIPGISSVTGIFRELPVIVPGSSGKRRRA